MRDRKSWKTINEEDKNRNEFFWRHAGVPIKISLTVLLGFFLVMITAITHNLEMIQASVLLWFGIITLGFFNK